MRLTFLGTGTSFGVPVVGCDCDTCTSSDPRDQRTRHGALLELAGGSLLVDTPPELRLQLLSSRVDRVDAVWFTHAHADHIHGIDDLRVFTVRGGALTAFVATEYIDQMQGHFNYIFDDDVLPPVDSSKPRLRIEPFQAGETVRVLGHDFAPVKVPHGDVSVYGFRVGKLGYVTDGKRLPPAAVTALRGVEVLVLNALWFGRTHASHFNIEEAIEAAREVGARTTYLTHLTHKVSHRELLDRLPVGVIPAYDGLSIEVE